MKKSILFMFTLWIGIYFFPQLEAQSSCKVTGEFILSENEDSFQNGALEISLYQYDPSLMDVSADLHDSLILRNCSHTKGKASKYTFELGAQQKTVPEMKYYLVASLFKNNSVSPQNYIFYGKPSHQDLGSVLTDNFPNHVIFNALKVKPYTENEKPQYPLVLTGRIPILENPMQSQILQLNVIVKQGVYPLDLGGKTKEDFKNLIQQGEESGKYPHPPAIDMLFELKNVGKETILFEIGGDQSHPSLKIEGDSQHILNVVTATVFTEEERLGTFITLKPQEKYQWNLSMTSGYRGSVFHYWLASGEYILKFKQSILLHRVGETDYHRLSATLESPEILVQVQP